MKQNRNNIRWTEKDIFTIPNILSFVRICLIPVIVWLYCVKHDPILAGGVLILSGVTDIADGYIARRFNMASNLGKVLDPIADKLTQAAMLFCLMTCFPWVLGPVLLMIAKEIFMSVTGIMVIKRTGIVLGAEWHGKAATCLLYAMILLHIFWYNIPLGVSYVTVAICTTMIAASFILYGIRNTGILMRRKS